MLLSQSTSVGRILTVLSVGFFHISIDAEKARCCNICERSSEVVMEVVFLFSFSCYVHTIIINSSSMQEVLIYLIVLLRDRTRICAKYETNQSQNVER